MNTPYIYHKRKVKKLDGTSGLYLRITLNKELVDISLKVYALPEHFDSKKQIITGGKGRKDLNLKIKEVLGRASGIVRKYDANAYVLTKDIFVREFLNPAIFVDFHAFMDDEIRRRRGEVADSTISQHLAVLSKMRQYREKLLLVELDEEYLKGFVKFMKFKLGNANMTYNNALKKIKIYVRKAIQQNLLERNPFDYYIIKYERTYPTFLTDEEVKALEELYDSNTLVERLQKVLRWFLFVTQTALRMTDLQNMTFGHITADNKLSFKPKKTENTSGIRVFMPLTKKAWQYINDEGQTNHPENTLFDCTTEQKMNKYLKEIGAKVDITRRIYFHTGRHTFATQFLRKTKAANGILVLQKLMGHTDFKSTLVYSHVIDTDIDDAMAEFGDS